MKPRILIFCDYYLPGYKSGGGTVMIANLVDRFRRQYDFFVVTRHNDGKFDPRPYSNVIYGDWNEISGAMVFYLAQNEFSARRAAEFVAEVDPSLVFLNSAFSLPVISLLNARRKGKIRDVPVILAPCGEMAPSALALKPVKKALFLRWAKAVKLYDKVIWKASFDEEKRHILRQFGPRSDIRIASDLVSRSILPNFDLSQKPPKNPGKVRFALVCRLTRMKNVHYFLDRLSQVREGEVTFELIGPLEDKEYWNECSEIISRLPPNISVSTTGPLPQNEALERLSQGHFLVLPTLNENFGYAFIEALAAGCPLLISENTSWGAVATENVGWVLPLPDREAWNDRIRKCIEMDGPSFSRMSTMARDFAQEWLGRAGHDEATKNLLESAISGEVNVS